jgi:hypothetical protein
MIDIQHLQKDNRDLIIVTLTGRLTTEEYDVFLPHFESEVRHFTDLLVLFDLREFEGWRAGSLWRKLSFNSNHRTSIEKIAVVGSMKGATLIKKACKPLSYGSIKRFRSRDMDVAQSWIVESITKNLRTRNRDLGV